MNKEDQRRVEELLDEIIRIFDSGNIQSFSEEIKDINKELKEIVDRNTVCH